MEAVVSIASLVYLLLHGSVPDTHCRNSCGDGARCSAEYTPVDPVLFAQRADKLLQSIHGKIDPEIEQTWIDEVQKRKESLKSGEASLHPASDVLNEARKRLQK